MAGGSAFPGFDGFADDADELVRQLTERRRRLGLSQAEVAGRMGTSQPAIARLESGRSDTRMSTLARYAEAVGTTIGFAIADAEERP